MHLPNSVVRVSCSGRNRGLLAGGDEAPGGRYKVGDEFEGVFF